MSDGRNSNRSVVPGRPFTRRAFGRSAMNIAEHEQAGAPSRPSNMKIGGPKSWCVEPGLDQGFIQIQMRES
jgi:hypothetical protein